MNTRGVVKKTREGVKKLKEDQVLRTPPPKQVPALPAYVPANKLELPGVSGVEAGQDLGVGEGSSQGGSRDGRQEHVARGARGRGQRPCRHLRGAYCTTHGMRGTKYFRPAINTTRGWMDVR